MSTTRLLILGAVRIFQPVHGYSVRRELVSWEVDRWAHLNPGSVYNALRNLSRDGFLIESATDPSSMGAPRTTTYELTHEGELEFLGLLRAALSTIDVFAADSLMAGIAFMWALPRDEVVGFLRDRLDQAARQELGLEAALEDIRCDNETPDHVQEIKRLVYSRMNGETEWAQQLIKRIEAGDYSFADDPQQSGLRLGRRC